eukprot:jgi/Mesen1/366/ME000001S02669
MAFNAQQNKQRLLEYLKEQGIEYDMHEHPVVLTVDEAAQHMGHVEGGHTKNLFLKDKKNRLMLICALTSTKVDLKSMAQRLGVGKGSLRMAPEENLAAVLQVPTGCVTPLAVFNPSARNVGLILDHKLKSHARVFCHPLSNDATIGVTPAGLEAFLTSFGREAAFVDLEAEVTVGKDQPPDLAKFLPAEAGAVSTQSAAPAAPREGLPPGTSEAPAPPTPSTSSSASQKKTSSAATATATKGKSKDAKGAAAPAAPRGPALDDVGVCTASILELALGALRAELEKEGSAEKRDAAVADDGTALTSLRQKLEPELQHLLVMYKNAAYTNGFTSGLGARQHAG